MDFKEQLNKIKVMLAIADAPAAPAASGSNPDVSGLVDYVLEDGTKCSIDKLEVGGAVTMNGTPAPDGEHKLQDGTIVETKDGKIVEISAPGEPSDDQAVNSDMNKFAEIDGKFASYEEKFAAYESRFAIAEGTINKQQEAIGQLLTLVTDAWFENPALSREEALTIVKSHITSNGKKRSLPAIPPMISRLGTRA
jgi:hypothetical protein